MILILQCNLCNTFCFESALFLRIPEQSEIQTYSVRIVALFMMWLVFGTNGAVWRHSFEIPGPWTYNLYSFHKKVVKEWKLAGRLQRGSLTLFWHSSGTETQSVLHVVSLWNMMKNFSIEKLLAFSAVPLHIRRVNVLWNACGNWKPYPKDVSYNALTYWLCSKVGLQSVIDQ